MPLRLKQDHETRFGPVDYEVYSPGRINLIGEHTDYNGGLVLPAAIDKGIHFYFSFPAGFRQFELYSENLNDRQTFSRETGPLPAENWAKYLQALIELLKKEEKIEVPGFQVSLSGNIPAGGGLSSSAALSAGFLTAINHHLSTGWTAQKMARLAQYTEHQIGARVGIMDPYAILAGKPGYFVLIDCYKNEHRLIQAHFEDYVLLLADTGITHDLADSEYNQRRAACEKTLECVRTFRKAESVSHITWSDLDVLRHKFPEVSVTETEYVLEENLRVREAVKAIGKNQWETVGQMMYLSHEGLQYKYRVSCPELDFLVKTARESGLVAGSRMMGGGFGGSTINLLKEADLKEYQEIASSAYQQEYQRIPRFFSVHPAGGATIL